MSLQEVEDLKSSDINLIQIDGYTTISEIKKHSDHVRVFVAIDNNTSQLVTIKLLNLKNVKNLEFQAEFTQESNALSLLEIKGVVKLLKHGRTDDHIYIVTEFISGMPISNMLIYGGISLENSLTIIANIASIMSLVHEHGVLHNDLNPNNIFIQDDGSIKIIDFGISHFFRQNNQNGNTIAGTPSYLAPEVFSNHADISIQSDIYSLGVVFYELVVGGFAHGNIDLAHIPIKIRSIIRKALSENPKDRYKNMNEFKDAINEFSHSDDFVKDSLKNFKEVNDVYSAKNSAKNILKSFSKKTGNYNIVCEASARGFESIFVVEKDIGNKTLLLLGEGSSSHDPVIATALYSAAQIYIDHVESIEELVHHLNNFIEKNFRGAKASIFGIEVGEDFKYITAGYSNNITILKNTKELIAVRSSEEPIGQFSNTVIKPEVKNLDKSDSFVFCNGVLDRIKVKDVISEIDQKHMHGSAKALLDLMFMNKNSSLSTVAIIINKVE